MTPNFKALQRISAAHHFLVTHPELPAFEAFTFSTGRVVLQLANPDAVDQYAAALGLTAGLTGEHLHRYRASNSLWVLVAFVDPGVETAENSGPERLVEDWDPLVPWPPRKVGS